MTNDELVALEHENWISYLTGVATCTRETKVTRAGAVMTLLTGLPMDWFNQILIEGQGATRAAVMAAVDEAREQGQRLRRSPADPTVREMGRPIYERLGFRIVVRYAS